MPEEGFGETLDCYRTSVTQVTTPVVVYCGTVVQTVFRWLLPLVLHCAEIVSYRKKEIGLRFALFYLPR